MIEKILTSNGIIEEIINSSIVKKAKLDNRDYSHFHPSEFDQCHRKLIYLFYESKGYIKVDKKDSAFDPRLHRIFDNGHHLHHRLGKNLLDSGMLRGVWSCKKCAKKYGTDSKLGILKPDCCSNCKPNPIAGSIDYEFNYHEIGFFDEETYWGGHVDAILDISDFNYHEMKVSKSSCPEEYMLIVDFKSMRQEKFRLLNTPEPKHATQMQIYLYLSGLKYGKFLYENKNDQNFKEFLVVRDDDLILEKARQASKLKQIALNTNTKGQRTLPPRPYTKSNVSECVECKFRGHCWDLK